jgi:hypothetical protein
MSTRTGLSSSMTSNKTFAKITSAIPADMLQCVFACMEHQIQLCMDAVSTSVRTVCDGLQFHKDRSIYLQHLITIDAEVVVLMLKVWGLQQDSDSVS